MIATIAALGWQVGLLVGLGLAAVVGLAFAKPIRQDLRYHNSRVIGWYALVKVVEWADGPLWRWTGISGHSWKHVAAGGGGWVLVALARA